MKETTWWESLKEGDKFKYANNVEIVDEIITHKITGAMVICSGEYRFSINHCTPYIGPRSYATECEEWLMANALHLDTGTSIRINSMIEKLRAYENATKI